MFCWYDPDRFDCRQSRRRDQHAGDLGREAITGEPIDESLPVIPRDTGASSQLGHW